MVKTGEIKGYAMRTHTLSSVWTRGAVGLVCVLSCAANVAASEAVGGSGAHSALHRDQAFIPFALIEPHDAGLAFDTAGSEVPKLQLRLTQPLTLEARTDTAQGAAGSRYLRTGGGLNFQLREGFGIGASAQSSFQSLGSIHCENGTLDLVSFHASNCHFVNERRGSAETSVVALNARYQLAEGATAGASLFQYRSGQASDGLGLATPVDAVLPGLLSGNRLFPEAAAPLGLRSFASSISGVDLEFEVGVSTDRAGEMVLGLQLTRILDGDFDAAYWPASGVRNWTIAEPFDSASLSFDWSKGAFSGGLQTYYREPVNFLYGNPLNSYSTFDVHFTWRAPWNASVSVGASNVLNAGAEDKADKNLGSDPFESVYGRIPYVRYKQDL